MSRGQIVRWMLEEIGVHYETRIIDYSSIKEADYLLVNPMGKVPAIRHDGKVVTESAAIVAYLADVFPDAGLAPRPEEKADYYRWMFFAAGPLEHAVINQAIGVTPTLQQQRMVGYGTYELALDVLDGWIGQRDYVCGSRFTAADVYVGSHILWGLQFGTIAHRPAFDAYAERLAGRDAYQRGKAIDGQLIAAMQQDQVPSEG
jgi:glutathione S-transferase